MNEKGKPSFGFLIIVTAIFQEEQEIKILYWYLLQARFAAVSDGSLLCDRQCGEADDKLASGSACVTKQLCAKPGLCFHPSLNQMGLQDQDPASPSPGMWLIPFSALPPNEGLGRGQRVTSAWVRGHGSEEEALPLSSLWQERHSGTQDWGGQVLWGWGCWEPCSACRVPCPCPLT